MLLISNDSTRWHAICRFEAFLQHDHGTTDDWIVVFQWLVVQSEYDSAPQHSNWNWKHSMQAGRLSFQVNLPTKFFGDVFLFYANFVKKFKKKHMMPRVREITVELDICLQISARMFLLRTRLCFYKDASINGGFY